MDSRLESELWEFSKEIAFLGDSVDSRPLIESLALVSRTRFWGIVWTAGSGHKAHCLQSHRMFLGDSVDSRLREFSAISPSGFPSFWGIVWTAGQLPLFALAS